MQPSWLLLRPVVLRFHKNHCAVLRSIAAELCILGRWIDMAAKVIWQGRITYFLGIISNAKRLRMSGASCADMAISRIGSLSAGVSGLGSEDAR